MERLILIETSTALCSTALAENGAVVAYRESSAPKAHASLTAVFIQEMLSERNISLSDCDAVCVSMGPGSYTGLRVGVSTAKGLCFGSGKPMIAVGTLDTLVAQAADEIRNDIMAAVPKEVDKNPTYKYIIPMIDARRMEVYTAIFAHDTGHSDLSSEDSYPIKEWKRATDTTPTVIDENSFAEYLELGPCLFIGDGAGKCSDIIRHPNAHFRQCHPKASAMLAPALEAYKEQRFEDVAYFEPFYLKEFVATVSKKKLF
ncbi:MAG: tRNA (adenosine(37)-N6)-threonylcarbamoyltransferase complex dimerization subunit type 1 TsaB [Bacteroidales bacterium]|nr:tRNA (adenosine(37)-N6)-threonylcarbamoyltransferase complex dimerization subunit type 1 TsaB [Bacteroidales bacterium]